MDAFLVFLAYDIKPCMVNLYSLKKEQAGGRDGKKGNHNKSKPHIDHSFDFIFYKITEGFDR